MPISAACGPSPRVRGTGSGRICGSGCRPVHPRVCGEQAVHRGRCEGPRPVHPRVCGEQSCLASWLPAWSAVHPRVCGEQNGQLIDYRHATRSIPACAGNSRAGRGFGGRLCGPSPRVRGTGISGSGKCCCDLGPSPRVRGTATRRAYSQASLRSIPACAGNRTWLRMATAQSSVHPRVCGEQYQCASQYKHHIRSIPACAGNRIR